MNKNVGSGDRILRLLLAGVFAGLYVSEIIGGFWDYIFIVVAVVLTLTSLVGFCPLYSIFGKRTCDVDS